MSSSITALEIGGGSFIWYQSSRWDIDFQNQLNLVKESVTISLWWPNIAFDMLLKMQTITGLCSKYSVPKCKMVNLCHGRTLYAK